MNYRNAARRILFTLGTSMAAMSMFGCGPRADDINTVQPGYVRKGVFQTTDEWYYRRTIVKSETTNALAIEGTGDIFLDRIKFRIEEARLIAYKPYEGIPGSQDAERPGKLDYQGPALASWPITSHFDIIADYDPQTGNKTNVIGENATDRPWYEREFMRVDWANNEIEQSMLAGWNVYEFVYYPYEDVEGTVLDHAAHKRWSSLETDPTNPFASRFSNDYVEVTNSVILGMDILTCAGFVGYSSDAFGRCGFGEAHIRSSFARIKEKSDFIPRDYPDSVVVKDAQGRDVSDPETGEVVREPVLDRFGYYRVELPTYDRGYGYTESGRLYRAAQFKLWKRYTDGKGNELPYAQREPNPIIYYLNAEFPDRWKSLAGETAAEYNRVLKGMVADLQGKSVSAVPDMFEIRQNDCNADTIRNFVSNKKELESAVARAVCPQGATCEKPLDLLAFGNLESVCSSLEAATLHPETGASDFTWQRVGDVRNKMLVWLANPQESGWGGYGPFHTDSRTGETVGATAYIRGPDYEIAAATIADYVDLMNGKLSVEDLIYGQNIRQQVAATVERARAMSTARAGAGLLARIKDSIQSAGATPAQRLKEVDPNYQINRMKRIAGTRVEERLTTEEDLIMASPRNGWRPGKPVTDEHRNLASPIGWATTLDPMSLQREEARRRLTAGGFCFLNLDFDQHYAGVANELKDMTRDQIFKEVARRTLKHVFLHELGHNFGLDHNFEGTYDALNYYDGFWAAHWGTPEQKIAAKYDERRNTTVMEYLSLKGMFSDTLGKYDEAALRFAYGNQVQVFNRVNASAVQGGRQLKTWRLLHDYSSLPEHLCAGGCSPLSNGQAAIDERVARINDRSWVAFDPQNPPKNEVPYEWCSPSLSWRTPFCKVFDYGSNQREIHSNFYTMWSAYYYFNSFIRDRLTWNWTSAMTPLSFTMTNANMVNQYLYYLAALDPNFVDSELGQDMAVTVAQALNVAAEVIATPEPVRMCPDKDQNPAIYLPYYYFAAGCDEYVPLDSDYAINAEMIQLPLGPARPSSIGFTDDFTEYDIAFVGSYFDKAQLLYYLGFNRPVLFRYDYQLDQRTYQASLYRLFEPELTVFLDRMITFDPYFVSVSTANELGAYWCRSTDDTSRAHLGYYLPRAMIDVATGESWPTQPLSTCEQPALVYPTLLWNMPFDAMYYAHALFSSDFDSELDLGKLLRIYVAGADDEPTAWRNLSPELICEVTDDLTSLRYRGVHAPRGLPDIACRMIERTKAAQVAYQKEPQSDWLKERARSWFERLEGARDLTRIYNP